MGTQKGRPLICAASAALRCAFLEPSSSICFLGAVVVAPELDSFLFIGEQV